ncbi:MAG: hemolysin family protein [Thermoplasmatota archaeon]
MALAASVVAELGVLLVLFGVSAFFASSETAFIGVNRVQVRRLSEAGDRKAAAVDAMLDDPERILSTVLVGNTIVNITAAAIATHIAETLAFRFATTIATVLVTLVILVVCELVPKTFAVQHPLPVARAMARPLRLVERILKPVIFTASALARGIVRPFGYKPKGKAPFITTDEIEILVRMGVEEGGVARFEQKVISDVFEFTATGIAKVMTDRAAVHFLRKEARLADAAQMSAKEGRTRILVVDEDFDHVLGCVHSRDLLRLSDLELHRLPVTHLLRRVLFADHDMAADRLLRRMQAEHCLLAVVTGADGANLGIVTAEDLLEELVGEIHDEFDAARPGHEQEHGAPRSG